MPYPILVRVLTLQYPFLDLLLCQISMYRVLSLLPMCMCGAAAWLSPSFCAVFIRVFLGDGEMHSIVTPSGTRVLSRAYL